MRRQAEYTNDANHKIVNYIIRSMNATEYRVKLENKPLALLCQTAFEKKRKAALTYEVVFGRNWLIDAKMLDEPAEDATILNPIQ